MPRKKIYDYEGRDVVVRYEPKRCIHAEECIHGLPEVFDRHGRPWIDPDKGSADDITEVVLRCPTGALRFERRDGGPAERPPAGNLGRLTIDGPLYLEGDLELHLRDESVSRETRVAICRCGASQNKPFCDNSHIGAGFRDPGQLGERRAAEDRSETEEGPLQIRVLPDGPLVYRGRVEIQSADGADAGTAVKGSLCRCGASQDRPYCDGSHAVVGFHDD